MVRQLPHKSGRPILFKKIKEKEKKQIDRGSGHVLGFITRQNLFTIND